MELLEVIYEGGEVLDLALKAQRDLLEGELGDEFLSVDCRGIPTEARQLLLRDAALGYNPRAVLIRGLAGVPEVAAYFPRAKLFFDMLGRSLPPTRLQYAMLSPRTLRGYTYGPAANDALRTAGIHNTQVEGPFFPALELDRPEEEGFEFSVGVLSLYHGNLELLGRLKRLRDSHGIPFRIVTQRQELRGVETVPDVLALAEASDLILYPQDQEEWYGPDEGAILAMCTGRALGTIRSDGLAGIKHEPSRVAQAAKYSPGSFVNAVTAYRERRDQLDSLTAVSKLVWDTVPRDILRRLQ